MQADSYRSEFLAASMNELKSPRPASRGFSVPEPSDDEFDDEEESDVEYLGEDFRSPSVEVIPPPLPPRAPSIPSSEASAKLGGETDLYATETDYSGTSPSSPEQHANKAEQTYTNYDKTITTLASTSLPSLQVLVEDHAHDSFDDDESESDDDLENPYHARDKSHPRHLERHLELAAASVPPIDASFLSSIRAPSPSDAAMAKPTNTAQAVAGQNTPYFTDELDPYRSAMSNDNTNLTSYGSFYPNFGSDLPTMNQQFLDLQPHQPDHNWPINSTADVYNMPQPMSQISYPTQGSTNWFRPASAASFTSEPCRGPSYHEVPGTSLKRKMDSMSQDSDDEFGVTSNLGNNKPLVKAGAIPTERVQGGEKEVEADALERLPAGQLPSWDEVVAKTAQKPPTSTTTTNSVAVAEADSGRPSKRLRLMEPFRRNERRITRRPTSRGTNAASYAATALGWMAVGAVGAIWALVSLPEDFFA